MTTELPINSSSSLADDFENFFNISKPIENDTSRPHPKFSQYCPKFSFSNCNDVERLQEKRRIEMLQSLKRKREMILDNLNLIAFIEDESNQKFNTNKKMKISPNNEHILLEMDVEPSDINVVPIQVNKKNVNENLVKNRRQRNFRRTRNEKEFQKLISNQLMLSEWLVDVPTDFYQEWFMLCCPRGKRTLVIAANGRTSVYSRTGYFMFHFQSSLSGGGRYSTKYGVRNKTSILDCIYVEGEHRFYVIDVISWNGCTFLDCETEFRFFWLHSRFNEELNESINNDTNIVDSIASDHDVNMDEPNTTIFKQNISSLYNFIPLPYQDCTVDNVRRIKSTYRLNTKIDGILFFHKRAPYTPGITPLVCWLKLDMIPKILNIEINDK